MILNGSEALRGERPPFQLFESSVILNGSEASRRSQKLPHGFESSVILNGSEAVFVYHDTRV